MELLKENIIGEVVAKNYRAAAVFKEYGIDFCCQGNRTIDNACIKKNVNSESVINDLNAALNQQHVETTDYKSWPLDLLADYIEKKHHRYVVSKTSEITPYLAKICRVHGERHPELIAINTLFLDSTAELTKHMKKEEHVLFPFIRSIVNAKQENSTIEKPHFGTIQNPIAVMMDEHEVEGGRFREIAELSNNYTTPIDACNTYRVTFALLKEFEEDLHLHIHLENNILFPNALKLEKEFVNA